MNVPRAGGGRRGAAALILAVFVLGTASCAAPSDAGGETATPAQAADQALKVIQHEVPKRDFVGPQPAEFRWSPVAGADTYAIGVWNESDRLMWRKDDITGPAVAWPDGLLLDYGTYFWSVSGLQNGREIAKSGTAAFVIEE